MSTFILIIVTGLIHLFGTQQIVNADSFAQFNSSASDAYQAQVRPISHTPTNATIIGVVPASAFPSCQDAIGGVLYVTRVPRTSAMVEHNDGLLDGPTCGTSLATGSAGANAGEPLLIVPATADGKLADRPCKIITTPQQFCEIRPGSLLSAFPLA
jgi:hypothetical protein